MQRAGDWVSWGSNWMLCAWPLDALNCLTALNDWASAVDLKTRSPWLSDGVEYSTRRKVPGGRFGEALWAEGLMGDGRAGEGPVGAVVGGAIYVGVPCLFAVQDEDEGAGGFDSGKVCIGDVGIDSALLGPGLPPAGRFVDDAG